MENRTYLVTEAEKLTGGESACAPVLGGRARHGNPPQFAGTPLLYCAGHSDFSGNPGTEEKGASPESDPRADAEAGAGNGGDQSVSGGSGRDGKGEAGSAIPGKADEVPEVVVDLLPEREAEQLADTVMRQEEEERQTEFYRVLGRLLDQMIQKRRQEERSRRVDEAIRRHQQSRREAAATLEQKGKRTKAKRGHRNNG